ncbi:AAA family ATPase [candidate division KSB1 bacterium]|nr:AAA family ATPase [candidate division KSB1 bacterium]
MTSSYAFPQGSLSTGAGRARSAHETLPHEEEQHFIQQASERMIPALSREQLQLRNTVLLAHELQGVRSVLVTGASEGSGATAIAATLALGLSMDQKKEVLMIDANVQRPQLHKLFRLLKSDSLRSASGSSGAFDMAEVSGLPNLRVISASGLANGLTFDTKRLASVLPALHEAFDFIVVDAPPLNSNAEILLLSMHLNSVIVVAEAERTSTTEIAALVQELQRAKAKLLGVVLNRQKDQMPALMKKWF